MSMRWALRFLDRPITWVYTFWIWGPRCTEFEPLCPTCQRWAERDALFE